MFPINPFCHEARVEQASPFSAESASMQNRAQYDDLDHLSKNICQEINAFLPTQAHVQQFQKILTSVFKDKMSSLSDTLRQHARDFQSLTSWVEAAQSVRSVEEFPRFDNLPEHMRTMLYKAVWMMCGKIDEFNFGENKCQENPFVLKEHAHPILHAKGSNLLEQSIHRFEDEARLMRDKLLISQLKVFTAAAEKLSDRRGVIDLFYLLDPTLQNDVLATMQEEANLYTYWGFGEEEIKKDILVLLKIERDGIPFSLREAYDRKDGQALKGNFESLCDSEKAILAKDVYENFIREKSQELVFTKILSKNESIQIALADIFKKRVQSLIDSKNDIKQRQNILPKEMQGVINLALLCNEEKTSASLAEGVKTLIGEHHFIEKLCSNIPGLSPHQLMTPGDMDEVALLTEVMKRGKVLTLLYTIFENLSGKYPLIAHALVDPQYRVHEMFQRFCLSCLIKPSLELDSQWQSFFATLLEMQNENLLDHDALMILERAMYHLTSSPLRAHLVDAIALKSLVVKTVHDIRDGLLKKGEESHLKPIYKVSTQDGLMAKFKFTDQATPNSLKNELASYVLDNLCFLAVTQPIARCRQKDLEHILHMHISLQQWKQKQVEPLSLELNKDLVLKEIASLDAASSDFAQKLIQLQDKITKIDAAKENRQVFDDMSDKIEEAIANLSFGAKRWLVQTIHKHFAPFNIGVTEDNLFWHWKENKLLSLEVKRQVLESALSRGNSEDFNGVVQLWIQGHIQRPCDLLTWENGDGGKRIQEISKTIVHLHILSGILKGSQDLGCGNAIFTFSDDFSMITSIKEFDDERGLPIQKDLKFSDLRLWQLGLPQATLPFDRSFMRIFCCEKTIGHIERVFEAMGMQEQGVAAADRFRQIQQQFVEQLQKNEGIALTPRELFFSLFGGREKFLQVKSDNSSMTDWEIFEKVLPEQYRDIIHFQDPTEYKLQQNLTALYQ